MLQFIIGLLIGGIIGFMFAGLLSANDCEDCQSEKNRDFLQSER